MKEGPLASHSVKSLTQGKTTSEGSSLQLGSSSQRIAFLSQKNNLKKAHKKPSAKAWGNSNSTNPLGSLSYDKAESSITAMTSIIEDKKSNKPLSNEERPTLGGGATRSGKPVKTAWGVSSSKLQKAEKTNKPLSNEQWPTLSGGATRSGKPGKTACGVNSSKHREEEETNDCLRTQGRLNMAGKFSA